MKYNSIHVFECFQASFIGPAEGNSPEAARGGGLVQTTEAAAGG